MRRLGWGCGGLAALVGAALVALLAWGGIHVVPGTTQTAGEKTVRAAGAGPELKLPPGVVLAVPVAGVPRTAIQDSWGDPRDNGLRLHHGTDLIAPAGTLVTAAAPGTIERLFQSAAGGTTLYIRSPRRRVVFYYAHLQGYAPGVHEGQVVRTGDPLGYVGDTGNAGAGNYHLHFGVSLTTPGQQWYQGTDIDPYPLLAGKPAPR